jgi:glycerol-3-phosphate dehydrogenase (NAD(P)+)
VSVAATPTTSPATSATTPTTPSPAGPPLPVAVIGAGSWGTALAIQFARSGHPTRLWGRDAAQREQMARVRENTRYLPGATFPDTLTVAPTLDAALDGARDLLVAVPSHALRATLTELRPRLRPDLRLAWATKGFELDTGLLPHQVARAVLGHDVPIAVLSGPTFAREVGAGLPTAMTVASPDPGFATALATSLSSSNFRAYTSTDIVGVEVGGAVKNVMAVGAGLSDGLGFGANTRIALITRGLMEMTRLGVALGARRETFMGLAGLGDLVLTCTDDQSRNRRFGLALAAGQSPEAALAAIGQVVEGYVAARAVCAVARRTGVSMPIAEGLYRTLYEGVPAREVVRELMTRPIKSEID